MIEKRERKAREEKRIVQAGLAGKPVPFFWWLWEFFAILSSDEVNLEKIESYIQKTTRIDK